MKNSTFAIGVLLIVAGLAALAYQGVGYTSRDTVLDIGPLHATAERSHWLSLPPIVGGATLLAGVALVAMGRRTAR